MKLLGLIVCTVLCSTAAVDILSDVNVLKYSSEFVVVFLGNEYETIFEDWYDFYVESTTRLPVLAVCYDKDGAVNAKQICDSIDKKPHVSTGHVTFPVEKSMRMIIREQVIRELFSRGAQLVIHSDVDVIFLKSPIDLFGESDIVFSRGTFPQDIGRKWGGFTVCAGFAAYKATPRTLHFLDDVISSKFPNFQNSDQRIINNVLAGDGMVWDIDDTVDRELFGSSKSGLRVKLLSYLQVNRIRCGNGLDISNLYAIHCLTDKRVSAKIKAFEYVSAALSLQVGRRQSTLPLPLQQHIANLFMKRKGTLSLDLQKGKAGGSWTFCTHMRNYRFNFNQGLAAFLAYNLAPSYALEIGCGIGMYSSFLARESPNAKLVIGVEPQNMRQSRLMLGNGTKSDEPVQLAVDLTSLSKKELESFPIFDLIFSIEVFEHIPRDKHDLLFDFISAHSSKFVIFSAGRIGQSGHGHISLRPKEEWRDEFLTRNFVLLKECSSSLVQVMDPEHGNHRKNVMVFAKKGVPISNITCGRGGWKQFIQQQKDTEFVARYWPHLLAVSKMCHTRNHAE